VTAQVIYLDEWRHACAICGGLVPVDAYYEERSGVVCHRCYDAAELELTALRAVVAYAARLHQVSQ
jgi:recombinational DNA repair protein (RecF pathway)